MKKTQLALAAVALVASSAAMAQVTLYGTADASVAKGTGGSTVLSGAGQWGASAFGVRGSEDLGSGLKANFNLEAGINLENGTRDNGGPNGNLGVGGLFNRAANVGLSGSFGSVTAGLQLSPFILSYVTSLALAGNNFLVPALVNGNAADGGGTGNAATGGFFIPNAVTYSTEAGGISASVMHATANGADNNRYTGGRVATSFGDLNVTAAIADRNVSYRNWLVGGTYAMGAIKLAGSYISSSDKTGGGAADINTTTLGASYALSEANTVGLNYARSAQSGSDTATITNVSFAHALSKSTSVYAFYNNTQNSVLSSYYNTTGNNAFGVGINKNF